MSAKILALEDRFMSKVSKTAGCWLWTASKDAFGYGMFTIARGRTRRAHRVSYEIANGPVSDGTVFLHTCDTPACVNPSHLRIGTRAENNADRDAKGRHWTHRGEAHGKAILTEDAVREIRSLPRQYGMAAPLAAKYGVSVATIYGIRSSGSSTWVGVR